MYVLVDTLGKPKMKKYQITYFFPGWPIFWHSVPLLSILINAITDIWITHCIFYIFFSNIDTFPCILILNTKFCISPCIFQWFIWIMFSKGWINPWLSTVSKVQMTLPFRSRFRPWFRPLVSDRLWRLFKDFEKILKSDIVKILKDISTLH